MQESHIYKITITPSSRHLTACALIKSWERRETEVAASRSSTNEVAVRWSTHSHTKQCCADLEEAEAFMGKEGDNVLERDVVRLRAHELVHGARPARELTRAVDIMWVHVRREAGLVGRVELDHGLEDGSRQSETQDSSWG